MAPITFLARAYFMHMTGRTKSFNFVMLTIEALLFILMIIWIYDRLHYVHWDEHNQYMEAEQTYVPGELFMLTVIWHIKANSENIIDQKLPAIRFDIILAFTAFFTLIKLFLQFEYTPSFGPLYKMMQRMMKELIKFLLIWLI